jgi:hypothetical protein
LTSGFLNAEGHEQHIAALGCKFLRKPFRVHELAHSIHQALDDAGVGRVAS